MKFEVRQLGATGWCPEWGVISPRIRLDALQSGTLAATCEFQIQPDRSAWFALEIASDLPHLQCTSVCDRLVSETLKRLPSQLRFLHSAAFADPPPEALGALKSVGFEQSQRIEQWQLHTVEFEGSERNFEIEVIRSSGWRAARFDLESLIERTNADASSGLGGWKPAARESLEVWRMLDLPVVIRVALYHGTPSGLLVSSFDPEAGDKATIEYLGVVPSWRRKGVASSLIQSLATAEVSPDSILTYITSDNSAARSAYSRAGFVRTRSFRPWWKRLSGSTTSAD